MATTLRCAGYRNSLMLNICMQWFQNAGFEDVKIKRIGPKWYRGVRRHGLIMGCSVTGHKSKVKGLHLGQANLLICICSLTNASMLLQPGDSPLQMGPKREESGKQNTSLFRKITFPFRLLLGSLAGELPSSDPHKNSERCILLILCRCRLLLFRSARLHVDEEPRLAQEPAWFLMIALTLRPAAHTGLLHAKRTGRLSFNAIFAIFAIFAPITAHTQARPKPYIWGRRQAALQLSDRVATAKKYGKETEAGIARLF